MKNQEIAAILEGTARLLELQQANPFRVRSYRKAAHAVRDGTAAAWARRKSDISSSRRSAP